MAGGEDRSPGKACGHPTADVADERLSVFAVECGIAECGNSQDCVKVFPKNIPLTTSIAKAARAATGFAIRRWLSR